MSDENNETPEVDTKELIQAEVQKAVAGLQAKNSELLGSIKDLKTKNSTLQSEIDNYTQAEAEAKQKALLQSEDKEKVIKELQSQFAKKETEYLTQLEAANKAKDNFIIDNKIQDALAKAGIKSELINPTLMLVKNMNEASLVDGEVIIKGQGLGEFIKEFTENDFGKYYLSAKGTTGGGSEGTVGNGQASADTRGKISREEYLQASNQQRVQWAKDQRTYEEGCFEQ